MIIYKLYILVGLNGCYTLKLFHNTFRNTITKIDMTNSNMTQLLRTLSNGFHQQTNML